MIDAEIGKCESHEDCILIWIQDCEFHTNTKADRKFTIEEIEWMEEEK